MDKKWKYKTGGIPDDMFIRGNVPMTKSEVRAVTIAKARLLADHVIWDIGAGTGSISIEAGIATSAGKVYAVEKEDDAVNLIKENMAAFGLDNITVCHGCAPEVLYELPNPDRVFVGGSGGNLREILRFVQDKLVVGGRLVINAVVLETLTTSVEMLEQLNFGDIEITQVSIAKTVNVGSVRMFNSYNPVFVISAEK
jgi:cobalt-precorrin-6B (C15)-methyltransferase